jgi:hypothetical protein
MLSKDWSAVSQMGSTMVTYAITNLPDMISQFQAAAQGMVGQAVQNAAEDAAT